MSDASAFVACPLCQSLLLTNALEEHLRHEHRRYLYRGQLRSLEESIEIMLADVLAPNGEENAWPTLVRLTREEFGPASGRVLANHLKRALVKFDQQQLPSILSSLASRIAPGNARLLTKLATSKELSVRWLALRGIAYLRPPFERRLLQALRGLLTETALPLADRLQAVATVLPHLEESDAKRLLVALLSGQTRRRTVRLLNQLEAITGPLPILSRVRHRVGGNVRMSCPRCGIEMRRNYMVGHLWQEHRLLLEENRVRDPWNVVAEWLQRAAETRDRRYLERCRIAVDKIDPQNGQKRLTRMLLARNLADSATRQEILNEAREQQASCCPVCFAFVPVPLEQPPLVFKPRADRVTAGTYRVEIDETGLRPWLEVATPRGMVFQGVEPDHPWTVEGRAFVWTLVFVLAALLCSLVWPAFLGPSLRPVVILLFVAVLVYHGILLYGRGQETLKERLLQYTWEFLVPQLHAGEFRLADSAFAAGLANWYLREERLDVPTEQVAQLVERTRQAVERGEAPAGHLAALVRWYLRLQGEQQADVVPLVARWLGGCFTGKLPLSFAQQLLEPLDEAWWSKANRARLRVLLSDRAFEAGFEVRTLLDAGQNAPALGDLLGVHAPRSLAALRLIWSMRPTRPWDKLGEVRTAFELAADPTTGPLFEEHPDLLLFEEDPDTPLEYDRGQAKMRPARLILTLAGVWLQEVIFSIPPRVFEIKFRSTGGQLILGIHVFRSTVDLDPFSRRLERWLRWVFHDFLRQIDPVMNWQSPHRNALLRAWGAVSCPECGTGLLPTVGQVGIALDEQRSESVRALENSG